MTTLARPPISIRPERLFTVQEYLRMVQAGIITERDRVELLNGRIIEKMAGNPPHDSALHRVMTLLMQALPDRYVVRSQSALQIPPSLSVPEPDIAVVRGPFNRFDAQHPSAADAVLVVEISDSTLSDDRGDKLGAYASGGVAIYWIVNLVDRRVEVYSDPTGPDNFPSYRMRHDVPEGRHVSLEFADGTAAKFAVSDMLPRKIS